MAAAATDEANSRLDTELLPIIVLLREATARRLGRLQLLAGLVLLHLDTRRFAPEHRERRRARGVAGKVTGFGLVVNAKSRAAGRSSRAALKSAMSSAATKKRRAGAAASPKRKREAVKEAEKAEEAIDTPADKPVVPAAAAAAPASEAKEGKVFADCVFFFNPKAKFTTSIAALQEIVVAQGGTLSKAKANTFAGDSTLTHYITTVEFIAANQNAKASPALDDDLDHAFIKFRVISEAFIHESIKVGKRFDEEKFVITSAVLADHQKSKE